MNSYNRNVVWAIVVIVVAITAVLLTHFLWKKDCDKNNCPKPSVPDNCQEYLASLYYNVLNRPPDKAGLAAQVKLCQQEAAKNPITKASWLQTFMNSPEFQNGVKDQKSPYMLYG